MQFAVVENPGFWNWTFNLVDEDDKMLAQIDRNWRGLGFEVIPSSLYNDQIYTFVIPDGHPCPCMLL
jgi:hypothetical protein